MAITCTPSVALAYSGDRSQTYLFAGARNDRSPDEERVIGLLAGDNVITVPTSGVLAQGIVMVPPPTNTAILKLKGNAGDVGVQLNPQNMAVISLDSGVQQVIVNASAPVAGVRFRVY